MPAHYRSDGSCEFVDYLDEETTSWLTAVDWAQTWLAEWRRDEFGPACEFINAMTQNAVDGVVAVVTVLVECAEETELGWVGAGPLEDLLSHSGNGQKMIDEVENLARRHALFKTALGNVWLGDEVDPDVRSRLVPLGARDLKAPQS